MSYLQRLKALDSEKLVTVDTAITAKRSIDNPFGSFDSEGSEHFPEIVTDSNTVSRPDPFDDRRYCRECSNLTSKGRCLAAWRGVIVASNRYCPIDDIPRRCEAFAPKANDPDQHTGRQGWPGLNSTR